MLKPRPGYSSSTLRRQSDDMAIKQPAPVLARAGRRGPGSEADRVESTAMDLDKARGAAQNFLVLYGFQILGAVVILIVGALLAAWAGKLSRGWLEKKNLEPPIRQLIVRAVKLLVFAMAVVLALDKFGVQIAPIVAALGVVGVGIGLAMQGMLGNLVAGLTIIFTKPFRVGEYIELLGVEGRVTDIELFSTRLIHADRSVVTVPNRKIIGEILHNYGAVRQLGLNVRIAYGADLGQALSVVHDILEENPRVLKDPAPVVGITTLGDSFISVSILPWVKVDDYGPARLEVYQAIVERFRGKNIDIPFPQSEVRLLGR
ncbi:MAG TPA: mechanosensitive ion channel family protein [Thermoanaerobaculia bacterium]|nr:mechanosensitive ion channel family protein [Thermoanaerobaculia bacterium]